MLKIMVIDKATPFLKRADGAVMKAEKSARKRAAYVLMKAMKTAAVQGESNYLGWESISPVTMAVRKAMKTKKARRKWGSTKSPMGALIDFVAYKTFDSYTEVGFPNRAHWPIVRQQARGFSKEIIPRLRRLMAAIGFPIRPQTKPQVPARPWIEEVGKHEERNVFREYRARFYEKLEKELMGL